MELTDAVLAMAFVGDLSMGRATDHSRRTACLAGKLAAAKRLTDESTREQASAGLDALTDDERAKFTQLNEAYVARFGFPFIIAVRDHDKASILSAFEQRLSNDRESELATACRQVERIATLRLKEILPQ